MAFRAKRPPSNGFFRKPLFWLFLLLLAGGAFRFYNLNWDLKHSFHPDERNILGQTAGIQAATGYRVQFFAYGQLPVYLYRATGELVSTPAFLVKWFGGKAQAAQWAYWIFLLAVFGGAIGFLRQDRFKVPAFGVTAFLFLNVLIFKFYPVFSIWAKTLHGTALVGATVLLQALVIFGGGALARKLLGIRTPGNWPWGAGVLWILLGILPAVLPPTFARASVLMAFLALVAGLGLWWAWSSRWGRAVVGVLSLWAALASLEHGPGIRYTGYGELMIIGRWWAAVFSTLTIGAVFLFVRRAYQNVPMALIAASFMAFAVVSIEQAHYCITESFISLMVVVIALAALQIVRDASWRHYLLAGAAFGLAMSAKTSSLYYVLIILMAHLISLAQRSSREWEREGRRLGKWRTVHSFLAGGLLAATFLVPLGVGVSFKGVLADLFRKDPAWGTGIWALLFLLLVAAGAILTAWGAKEFRIVRAQVPQWIRLAAAGGLAFFLFCLLSPWSLLDYAGFKNSMNYEWRVVAHADAAYVLQFKDTSRYLFHLKNLMHVELWWPLGITVVLGAAWVVGRFLFALATPRTKGALLPVPFLPGKGFALSMPDLILLAWFIPYFGFIGSWNTKFIRYMVPLIPVFCVFGARFLTDLFEWLRRRQPVAWRPVRALVLAVVIGSSLFYSIAYMNVYRNPHPWIEASVWIFKNVPLRSVILKEHWDDGLPTGVDPDQDPRVDRPMGPHLYGEGTVTAYEMHGYPTDDTPVKKDYYANLVPRGDYISIASKKLWYTLTDATPEFRPDGFNVYPVTSRYYRLLWSGLLGYKMVGDFHNFPSFLGWEHPDDMAEESFSVYDHPRAYLFKKVEEVQSQRIRRMLETDDYVRGIDRELMRTITPGNVDAFIAERRRYLEEKGLWDRLMGPEAEGVPVRESKEGSPPEPGSGPGTSPPLGLKKDLPGPLEARTREVLEGLVKEPRIEAELAFEPAPEDSLAYQVRAWLSWVLFLMALGWLALPLTLRLLAPLAAGAFSLSKILGFFVFAWLVWFPNAMANLLFPGAGLFRFDQSWCGASFLILALLAGWVAWRDRDSLKAAYSKWGKAWWIQEGAFVLAFLAFTLVKIHIAHIHDPVGEGYNGGGEAGMDYGFLASIVRGESFPPQNMWMAGEPIGYSFYYGHLMMGVLTKTLGLLPEVTYNLGLITLFALIFVGAFGLAFALSGRLMSGWVAGFLCAAAGNPVGARQVLESIQQCFAQGSLAPFFRTYDYWGPTRVIPHTINEFPYFSVLYGDLHAHTLAMPFAMLWIGLVASFYLSPSAKPPGLKREIPLLLSLGALLGGLAFLNTWEVPVWLVFLGLAFLIRGLVPLNGAVLFKGLLRLFLCVTGAAVLLGWWNRSGLGQVVADGLKIDLNPHALGGSPVYFVSFLGVGLLAALAWIVSQKSTRILGRPFLFSAAGLALVLVSAGVLWAPFFEGFTPQQSRIMWVKPDIRTKLSDYFGIHGFFLSVLALGFWAAYAPGITAWIGRNRTGKGKGWGGLLDRALAWASRILRPGTAVQGMMALGIGTLTLLWGASWIHWAEGPGNRVLSQGLATAVVGLLAAALWFKDRAVLWASLAGVVVVWVGLQVTKVVPFAFNASFLLDLGLFSVLWLLAFFHLGLAVRVFRDRSLSFAYLLVSFFLFVTATLEIFVMSEFFGFGQMMRNNSMFKYGIIAWTLASVATGVFLPRLLELFAALRKTPRSEAPGPRRILIGLGVLSLILFFQAVFGAFFPALREIVIDRARIPFLYLVNLLGILAVLAWSFLEGWVGRRERPLALGVAFGLSILALVPLIGNPGYRTLMGYFQRLCGDFNVAVLFPAVLAAVLVSLLVSIHGKRKDLGRRLASGGWMALVGALFVAICVYPVASSWRKAHGFTDANRKQWVGEAEPRTLNGLAFLDKANPADAAAIRFLNDHVPGQPCLVEFVGEGYNSWGSRISTFTGIPALMGWDGHVGEWVGARQGQDIRDRFNATERIFRTTDPGEAKRILDDHGVDLVVVGPLERQGVPGRKGGYPPEGLGKFREFLPLIYKNPQVEIYYNPPSENQL